MGQIKLRISLGFEDCSPEVEASTEKLVEDIATAFRNTAEILGEELVVTHSGYDDELEVQVKYSNHTYIASVKDGSGKTHRASCTGSDITAAYRAAAKAFGVAEDAVLLRQTDGGDYIARL